MSFFLKYCDSPSYLHIPSAGSLFFGIAAVCSAMPEKTARRNIKRRAAIFQKQHASQRTVKHGCFSR
jgi:hypothetical protein